MSDQKLSFCKDAIELIDYMKANFKSQEDFKQLLGDEDYNSFKEDQPEIFNKVFGASDKPESKIKDLSVDQIIELAEKTKHRVIPASKNSKKDKK